jgi:hypothetical protein
MMADAFYTRTGPMTDPGPYAALLDALPRDVAGVTGVVPGLLLHEHWASNYGVELTEERRSETHTRSTRAMLERALALDDRPLGRERPVEHRVVGTCRNFSVLTTAMLRRHGVPARARCGFATYFTPDCIVDHWVAEYWNVEQARWIMVDAQLDAFQRSHLHPDFDPLDVPRDRFLVAGEAWRRCRSGEADPALFGIMDMRGLWFVAGNVLRDLAALNNMEMLPWDVWGVMPQPDEPIDPERLALLDRLAALGREPDRDIAELRAVYEADERLRVPPTVYNARTFRPEPV